MKKKEQLDAWKTFRDEIPWLNKSHRCLVEIACIARADLISGAGLNVRSLNLLRQCLGQMAATPTDASKVTLPDDAEGKDPPGACPASVANQQGSVNSGRACAGDPDLWADSLRRPTQSVQKGVR
jgi:hypothetical protein